ncbi:MAG: uroporphyrinogen-III C-methyltransferase [Bacteroidota bacterium]
MSSNKQAKITLVGAGPGDVDLITYKGLKALQTADVVLYDALINPELLKEVPDGATLVYVGKRANQHAFQQKEINEMLVAYAYQYGHVVRLKGGDAFVFGRGQEEMAHAKQSGVPVEVVPGISSCIAVPELQHVPVTARSVSESFWVITGTTRSGQLSSDIALAAQSTATVIILMGIRKLAEIRQLFIKEGRFNTPAMVVQNGSREGEHKVVGTIDTILEQVQDAQIGTPGIIVIGDVVRLHPEFVTQAIAEQTLQQAA